VYVLDHLRKLLHDPSLTTRRVVFAAIDGLLPTTNLAFSLGYFEFAVQDILKPHVTFFPPSRRGEFFFLENLLDHGLNGGRFEGRLRHAGGARRWDERTGPNDTAGGACEDLSFTPGDLCFPRRNVTLTGDES
jgi:hypothetical protein